MKKKLLGLTVLLGVGLYFTLSTKSSYLNSTAPKIESSAQVVATESEQSKASLDSSGLVQNKKNLMDFIHSDEAQKVLNPPGGDSERLLDDAANQLPQIVKTATELSILLGKCLNDESCTLKRDDSKAYFDESNTEYHRMLAQSLRTLKSALARTEDRGNFPSQPDLLSFLTVQNDEIQTVATSILIELPNSSEHFNDILSHAPDMFEMARSNFFIALEPLSRTSSQNREKFIQQVSDSFRDEDAYASTLLSKNLGNLNLSPAELQVVAKGTCEIRKDPAQEGTWNALKHDFGALKVNLNTLCSVGG